jgi:hypothetical protein
MAACRPRNIACSRRNLVVHVHSGCRRSAGVRQRHGLLDGRTQVDSLARLRKRHLFRRQLRGALRRCWRQGHALRLNESLRPGPRKQRPGPIKSVQIKCGHHRSPLERHGLPPSGRGHRAGVTRVELAGLRWSGIDLDAGAVNVSTTRVVVDYKLYDSTPKTASGNRAIGIDSGRSKRSVRTGSTKRRRSRRPKVLTSSLALRSSTSSGIPIIQPCSVDCSRRRRGRSGSPSFDSTQFATVMPLPDFGAVWC